MRTLLVQHREALAALKPRSEALRSFERAMDAAVERSHWGVVQVLLRASQAYPLLASLCQRSLNRATASGNAELYRLCREYLRSGDDAAWTSAAKLGHVDLLRVLLERAGSSEYKLQDWLRGLKECHAACRPFVEAMQAASAVPGRTLAVVEWSHVLWTRGLAEGVTQRLLVRLLEAGLSPDDLPTLSTERIHQLAGSTKDRLALRALARAAGNPLTAVSSPAASGGSGAAAGGGESKAAAAVEFHAKLKAAATQPKPARGATKQVRLSKPAAAVSAQVRPSCAPRGCCTCSVR